MKTAIEKFINNPGEGLFLLDSPTGFGKTYTVKKILKEFLAGNKYRHIKRMFFVTNLKTNLPYEELCEELPEADRESCIRIKAFDEDVIEHWKQVRIPHKELVSSEEFRNLDSDIEIYNGLIRERNQLKSKNQSTYLKEKSIKSFQKKIASITEPNFRRLIKKLYFEGKSSIDKKKFINENSWLVQLYPICRMENKDIKVIFMTTAKFFSPISLFYRMPFYMYNDNILKDSVVFIDEFDSSKHVVLDQIIENSLKINVDVVSLFTNIYYVLHNQEFPAKLLAQASDTNSGEDPDSEIDDELRKYSSDEILTLNKEKFSGTYEKHNFDYLLKSYDFNTSRVLYLTTANALRFITINRKSIYRSKKTKKKGI